MLLKLAWRNLWRHKTRTFIMGSAVALAYGLMLAGFGIADDGHHRMIREGVKAAGGDVLVHGKGYWDSQASDIVIEDGDRTLATVRAVPGVQQAYPRVLISGLVSTSADNRPVLLQGVDPGLEAGLHDYPDDLVDGTYFGDGRDDPLVLGSRLAQHLEVGVGDRVVLTASGPDGEMTRALFHVTGIVESGQREMDEVLGLTTVDAARDALGDSTMLTQVGVLTAEGADHNAVADSIRAAVAAEPDSLEVLTWEEAIPEMVGFVEIDDAFGYIYYVVIFAVVLFSITNTFLMAVMERVREFGLLNALGLRNERIGRLLLTETVLLTAMAMGVGFLLGYAGHLAANHWGIPISSYGVDEIEMSGVDMADMVMRSTIIPLKWAVGSVLVAIATIGAAIYPARRAAKLAPAEAMRFYE